MTLSKLTAIIENNKKEGRLTKIPFLSASFPSRDGFWEAMIQLAENGADIIEIGIPFSDPVADGPVVAAASQEALENGASLDYVFEGLKKHRARLNCGLVLMGYVNPFIQYFWAESIAQNKAGKVQEIMAESLGRFAKKAAAVGVNGLIVPDLPLDETGLWRKPLADQGLDLIALVGPNTGLERMKRYAEISSGYVYVVSVLGTTGVREGLPPEVAETIKRAKQAFKLPLALGFGLSSPDQLAGLTEDTRPDAAVFGSALIKHLKGGGQAKDFMIPWNV